MLSLTHFVLPPIPAGIPATPKEILALDRKLDAKRNEHSQYEQDAYSRSGRRSDPLARARDANDPVQVTPASPDVREDNSMQTHEAATSLVSTTGTVVSRTVTALIAPAMAATAAMSLGGGSGDKGKA